MALYFLIALNSFYLYLRYFSPLLTAVIVLTMGGMLALEERIGKRFPKVQKRTFGLVAGIHVLALLLYIGTHSMKAGLIPFYTNQVSRKTYRYQRIAAAPIADLANEKLNPQSKTYLFMTGNRFHLYANPVEGGYFSGNLIKDTLETTSHPSEVNNTLHEMGFTHILFYDPLAQKFLGGLPMEKNVLFRELMQSSSLVGQIRGFVLVSLPAKDTEIARGLEEG